MAVVTNGYQYNEELIWSYLVGTMGLNKKKACGILAAIYTLSGFDNRLVTTVSTDSMKNYFGLFQWRGDKWKQGYKDYYYFGILGKRKTDEQYKIASYQMKFFEYDIKNVSTDFWEFYKSAPKSKAGAISIYVSIFDDYNTTHPKSGSVMVDRNAESVVNKFWKYYISNSGSEDETENPPTDTTYDDSSMTGTGSTGGSTIIASNEFPAEEYDNLTNYDIYAESIKANLSKFAPTGYDFYGYLIDLTHGGEFKFYIPEFNEAAGVEYQEIDIPGRSVTLRSYNKTNSRIINISLDLYAGAGVYNGLTGTAATDRLHSDLNFVKSLEYPDYTNPIARPPSVVQLILGSAVNLTGVVTSVTVNHLKPLDIQNRSMYAKLNFSVVQTAINPPDYTDIRKGSYSLTSTGDLSSLYTAGTTIDGLDDVESDDWFFGAVKYVYEKEYMVGVDEDSFEPDSFATRAQIATIIWRMADEPATGSHNFTDIEKDSYYEKAVAWASSKGIVLGYDDGTFRPDQFCTREQAVVFLYRYAKALGKDVSVDKDTTTNFDDASSISPYALEAIKWAMNKVIIVGYENKLRPTDTVKRSELAVMIQKFEQNL